MDGVIRFANPRAEAVFDVEPGGAVGERPEQYLAFRGDEAVRDHDVGTPQLLQVSRTDIVWNDEAATILVLRDITAERAMEKVRHTVVGAHYPDLARGVIRHGASRFAPEERQITALFVDLKGSTRIGATRGVLYLSQILDALYAMAIDAVAEQGGSISSFIGDAILATFNAPSDLPDHELAAVRAGQGFLRRLAKHRAASPDLAFDVHIGVESGSVLAGDIGPEQRHEYTVTGACVNFASRLTKLPFVNEVVVGPTTASALDGRAGISRRERVMLEGFGERREVFVVVAG